MPDATTVRVRVIFSLPRGKSFKFEEDSVNITDATTYEGLLELVVRTDVDPEANNIDIESERIRRIRKNVPHDGQLTLAMTVMSTRFDGDRFPEKEDKVRVIYKITALQPPIGGTVWYAVQPEEAAHTPLCHTDLCEEDVAHCMRHGITTVQQYYDAATEHPEIVPTLMHHEDGEPFCPPLYHRGEVTEDPDTVFTIGACANDGCPCGNGCSGGCKGHCGDDQQPAGWKRKKRKKKRSHEPEPKPEPKAFQPFKSATSSYDSVTLEDMCGMASSSCAPVGASFEQDHEQRFDICIALGGERHIASSFAYAHSGLSPLQAHRDDSSTQRVEELAFAVDPDVVDMAPSDRMAITNSGLELQKATAHGAMADALALPKSALAVPAPIVVRPSHESLSYLHMLSARGENHDDAAVAESISQMEQGVYLGVIEPVYLLEPAARGDSQEDVYGNVYYYGSDPNAPVSLVRVSLASDPQVPELFQQINFGILRAPDTTGTDSDGNPIPLVVYVSAWVDEARRPLFQQHLVEPFEATIDAIANPISANAQGVTPVVPVVKQTVAEPTTDWVVGTVTASINIGEATLRAVFPHFWTLNTALSPPESTRLFVLYMAAHTAIANRGGIELPEMNPQDDKSEVTIMMAWTKRGSKDIYFTNPATVSYAAMIVPDASTNWSPYVAYTEGTTKAGAVSVYDPFDADFDNLHISFSFPGTVDVEPVAVKASLDLAAVPVATTRADISSSVKISVGANSDGFMFRPADSLWPSYCVPGSRTLAGASSTGGVRVVTPAVLQFFPEDPLVPAAEMAFDLADGACELIYQQITSDSPFANVHTTYRLVEARVEHPAIAGPVDALAYWKDVWDSRVPLVTADPRSDLVEMATAANVQLRALGSKTDASEVYYTDDIDALTTSNEARRDVLHTTSCSVLALMSLEASTVMEEEAHGQAVQFMRIEQGSGLLTVEGQTYDLEENAAVVIPAGKKHTISTENGMKFYVVYSGKNADAVDVVG